MTTLLCRYLDLETQYHHARCLPAEEQDEQVQEGLITQLDQVWLELSEEDRRWLDSRQSAVWDR